MTIDKSLRGKGRLARARNVLKREERMAMLQADDRWTAGRSPLGLPKVRVWISAVGKKKKKKAKEEADTTAAADGTTPCGGSQGGCSGRQRPQAPPSPQHRQNRLPAKSRDRASGLRGSRFDPTDARDSGPALEKGPRARPLSRCREIDPRSRQDSGPLLRALCDAHRPTSARTRRCNPACAGPPRSTPLPLRRQKLPQPPRARCSSSCWRSTPAPALPATTASRAYGTPTSSAAGAGRRLRILSALCRRSESRDGPRPCWGRKTAC